MLTIELWIASFIDFVFRLPSTTTAFITTFESFQLPNMFVHISLYSAKVAPKCDGLRQVQRSLSYRHVTPHCDGLARQNPTVY